MSKIVLITGATSGIGEACAHKFAKAKYDIIVTGRRIERLNELKELLEKSYESKVLTLSFDVQDKNEVFDNVNNLPDEWRSIDVLINNAGLALGKETFDEANLLDWDQMLHTNVNGLLYVSKAVVPFMIKNKNGHIINLGSIAGKEVYESGNVYCASKFAVDAISRGMRIDLLKHKIKVTCINPGAVETEFSLVRFKGNESKAKAAYEGYVPLTANDIADTIFYCATLPAHVCINDLVITCVQQAGTYYFQKDGK